MSHYHALRCAVLAAVLAACGSAPRYDLVLANGRVMDPATGLDSVRHIGITAGKIAAISTEPLTGDSVVDVANLVVVARRGYPLGLDIYQ